MPLRAALNRLVKPFRRFIGNDRGNLSLILGLSILPVMICAGMAVDFERGVNAKTQLQASVDTATLYAAAYSANTTGATAALMTTLSKPYLTQNYEDAGDAAITNYTVVDNGTSITGTVTAQYKTYFMALAGYTTQTLMATSTVQKSGINLEVSLVLDNTTSMNSTNAKTGNTAMTDLKAAAAKFVSTVMPATQGTYYTKIAVVPYNNSVNMGSITMAATARGAIKPGNSNNGPGRTTQQFYTSPTFYANYSTTCDNYAYNSNNVCQETLTVTNCVTERTGSAAYTDASIAANPVGWHYANSNNGCTATPMVPLTTSTLTLTTTIAAMSAGGSTGGQIGIAWGWYTLSPNVGIWSGTSVPAGYDKLTTTDATSKVRKVMILMTDGEYNSAYCNGVITGYDTTNGSAGNPYYWSVVGSGGPADHIGCAPTNGGVYTQANQMCTAIKASGVEVYVITFQLDKSYPQRVNLVNNCATDSSHVIDADSTSLDSAFQGLANKILAMRISS